jgi:hypothetical protein
MRSIHIYDNAINNEFQTVRKFVLIEKLYNIALFKGWFEF